MATTIASIAKADEWENKCNETVIYDKRFGR